jgi:ABC-2 type transport system permease protein
LRKYAVIYKATLMENMQYALNIALGFISYFMMIFVFINLWDYIYSDSSQLIAGYNKEQMIWYIIITEMIWFGTRSATITREVANDIKSGQIAYGINKPYHYTFYILAKYFGEISIRLILYISLAVIVGVSFVGGLSNFRILYLPAIIVVLILGIIINAILKLSISLISFWIEDSNPFQWLYDKLILVIGTIFPVEIFPRWAQPIIRCTPIYVVVYGPAKLIVDFSMEMFFRVLATQLIYLGIAIVIMLFLYKKGVKKVNVNGG